MPTPLILTFAELEFLLASCPPPVDAVRARLRLASGGPADGVVAAGLASLLARGLCSIDPTAENPYGITMRPELLAAAAGLVSNRTRTSAAGWVGEQAFVTHFFDTPQVRLALRPGALGRFAVDFGEGSEPLGKVANTFVDWCARDGGPAAAVVESTDGERTVSFAVALEPDGTWYMSDSGESPDRGTPTSRGAIRRRVSALLEGMAGQGSGGSVSGRSSAARGSAAVNVSDVAQGFAAVTHVSGA